MTRATPWREISLGTVIVEKPLFLDGEGKVTVRIGAPLVSDDGRESACPYRIEGLGAGKLRYAVGIDRLQALRLALETIGADLYASEEYKAGRLKAFAVGDDHGDLGFPVLRGFEDLLPTKAGLAEFDS
jgi:hypothetical protein